MLDPLDDIHPGLKPLLFPLRLRHHMKSCPVTKPARSRELQSTGHFKSHIDATCLVPGLAESEDFLQDVAVIGWMVAGIGWSCAIKESRRVIVRACRIGQQIRRLV